jgi:hypothetical protein
MTQEIDLGSILLKTSAVGSSNCAHECVRELNSDGFGADFNGTSFTAHTPRFMLFVFGRGCNTVAQGLVQQMLCRMEDIDAMPSCNNLCMAVGDDALVDSGEPDTHALSEDVQMARSVLSAADVLHMTRHGSMGVSTRQLVWALIENRLAALAAQPPKIQSALMALKAVRLDRRLEKRLEPIVIAMDHYGSHGVSVSQLLWRVVDTAFACPLAPGEPLAGDGVLLGGSGDWFGTPVVRVDANKTFLKKKEHGDLIDQLPSSLVALGASDPGGAPKGYVRLYVVPRPFGDKSRCCCLHSAPILRAIKNNPATTVESFAIRTLKLSYF